MRDVGLGIALEEDAIAPLALLKHKDLLARVEALNGSSSLETGGEPLE